MKYLKKKLKILFKEGKLLRPFGELSLNWQGGKSFEPYPITFNRLFKQFIRERDKFGCLKCNLFEIDCKKLYNKNLTVHHIDYIKENTFKENCCTLCTRCNLEVNANREHWKKFFQSLLSERYNYKYSENNEIIVEVQNG